MPKQLLTTIILSLATSVAVTAQQVWPGDVNNNGTVNEVDVLYWGIAFGSMGPQRDDPDTDWMPYDAPLPWPQNFVDGLNYAFADCNGDGVVDEVDVQSAIAENFGEEHMPIISDGYGNTSGSAAPRVSLQPSMSAVEEGAMVDISLRIDDLNMPVDSFYGLALSMTYTTNLLEDDEGMEFELQSDTWLDADSSFVYSFYQDDEQGSAALAITRTNQASVPVEEGEIAYFSIVIEDIIVGLEVDTFFLQVDSVKLITPGQTNIAIVPDTAQIIVAKDLTVSASKEEIPITTFILYPNPMNGAFYIESESPFSKPLLFDQMGRALPLAMQKVNSRTYRLQCPPSLSPGLYWLRLKSEKGVVYQKVIFSN